VKDIKTMRDALQSIDVGTGTAKRCIAVRVTKGHGTPVVWLGGFKSDMTSTKAARIDEWCQANNRPMVRMDYAGHGESSGRFQDFVFSDWLEDAQAVLKAFTKQPPILVGSSMGGWMSVLIAKRLFEAGKRNSFAGLVLIAPACDFTKELMWPQFPDHVKQAVLEQGFFNLPSAYSDEPTPITRKLIEDGDKNLVFGKTFQVGCAVHILQGMKDPDVPFQHALRLVEHLPLDPVTTTLINDGDHRLSREQDIAMLIKAVAGMGSKITEH
jgi:pimeloyl-ACP methyl ester carboxylesterase